MNLVTLCENVLDPESWKTQEVEDVRKFLLEHFGVWPATARIYHTYVAESADVTPVDEATTERLGQLTGQFYVVVYPEGIETIFIVIAIAVAAVAIGLAFLLRPSLPDVKGQTQESPNNSLSSRQNKERPNERIPDIYGKLWSTPDLIAVPYRIFIDNQEVEYSYLCIGRGQYTIYGVRDDTTPIAEIDGSSVEIYSPGTSPNSGDDPVLRIGAAINTKVFNVKQSNSVNGQTVKAPNIGGDWVGPFYITNPGTKEIWANFVAPSGSYKIDSSGVQTAVDVACSIEVTPVDANLNPTGIAVETSDVLLGADDTKHQRGLTIKYVLAAASAVAVRAKRNTNTTIASGTSVSDEIQWRDLYAITPVTQTEFGDVTTIQAVTWPTQDALAIKQRKLNCLVSRNLPTYNGDGTFNNAVLIPTKNAADILCAMSLDPFVGGRVITELDVLGIYAAVAAVEAYFGTSLATEFCYTFDDSKVSFEESVAAIASAIFCTAFRRGSILSLMLEKLTANSTKLFNHRNKIPSSETRTVTFGRYKDFDGIEYEYVDPQAPNYPNLDSKVTLYYPEDQSAKSPKKISGVGIRNNVQAWFQGWRAYNKLRYQNTAVEFTATQDAAPCVINERILVADNTRPDTQDGEVNAQDSLQLTLSQPVTFVVGRSYTIFLQHYDQTIEAIAITPGVAANQVVLAAPPSAPLVVDQESYAKTGYVIVSDAPQRASSFLLSEKTPDTGMTFNLKAINYDDRFYANDVDFINEDILFNGGDTFESPVNDPIAPTGSQYRPRSYDDLELFRTANPQGVFSNGGTSTVTGATLV